MLAIATIILIAGVVDDLWTRKVHNALFLCALFVAFASSFIVREWSGTQLGLLALLLAFVITIPLFYAHVLGGGDVKLIWAFAIAVEPNAVFWTIMYSIVWGGIFGFTRSMLQGQLPMLVRSTYHLATRRKVEPQQLHKIPFTFALLLGWFTHLTMLKMGGV
jgi:Flp pilus assembly protein protease CpaA